MAVTDLRLLLICIEGCFFNSSQISGLGFHYFNL